MRSFRKNDRKLWGKLKFSDLKNISVDQYMKVFLLIGSVVNIVLEKCYEYVEILSRRIHVVLESTTLRTSGSEIRECCFTPFKYWRLVMTLFTLSSSHYGQCRVRFFNRKRAS